MGLTLQNDRFNLSFAKDIQAVAKKWPKVVLKRPFIIPRFWETPSSFKITYLTMLNRKLKKIRFRKLSKHVTQQKVRLGGHVLENHKLNRRWNVRKSQSYIPSTTINTQMYVCILYFWVSWTNWASGQY